MTRQQAIDIASKGQGGGQAINFSCAGFVDCLIALGVLKIDEPLTVGQKLENIYVDWAHNYGIRPLDLRQLRQRLDAARLKVVEK